MRSASRTPPAVRWGTSRRFNDAFCRDRWLGASDVPQESRPALSDDGGETSGIPGSGVNFLGSGVVEVVEPTDLEDMTEAGASEGA